MGGFLLQECNLRSFVELSITQKWIKLTFKYFPLIDESMWHRMYTDSTSCVEFTSNHYVGVCKYPARLCRTDNFH